MVNKQITACAQARVYSHGNIIIGRRPCLYSKGSPGARCLQHKRLCALSSKLAKAQAGTHTLVHILGNHSQDYRHVPFEKQQKGAVDHWANHGMILWGNSTLSCSLSYVESVMHHIYKDTFYTTHKVGQNHKLRQDYGVYQVLLAGEISYVQP